MGYCATGSVLHVKGGSARCQQCPLGEAALLLCLFCLTMFANSILMMSSYSKDWFPALLSGDQQQHADACWKLCEYVLDLFNENSHAYASSTDEDRAAMKPLLAPFLWMAGDCVSNASDFSWDYFRNGDALVEHFDSYVFEEHHTTITDIVTVDVHMWGTEAFILTLQYGRVEDAQRMMVDQCSTCAN